VFTSPRDQQRRALSWFYQRHGSSFKLRELGQLLIQIHGQHAHQLLVKSEHQKALLDGYAGEYALTQQMAEHYRQWHTSCRELAQHQQQSQERTARAELLHYQLKELNEFNPLPGEFEQIDEEYKRLANSGQLLSKSACAEFAGRRRRCQSAKPALYRTPNGYRTGRDGCQLVRRPHYARRSGNSGQRGQR
jgi:DNA repair ATPase RecN